MTVELALVKNISVKQDDDKRVYWTSAAAVDADGSNGQNGNLFAYRSDDKGLDALANAGWPDRGWKNVLLDDGQGTPMGDSNGNWYSQTTYLWKNTSVDKRYVDSSAIAYVVVNPVVRKKAKGIVIGCLARVTYKDKVIEAVVADVSGSNDIGELSIKSAELLGIPSSPRNGGVSHGVLFELWPGTPATVSGQLYELQRA